MDTISGLPESQSQEWPSGDPVVVRYAKEMKFQISIKAQRTNYEEMIYVPILYITYRERTSQYIEGDD